MRKPISLTPGDIWCSPSESEAVLLGATLVEGASSGSHRSMRTRKCCTAGTRPQERAHRNLCLRDLKVPVAYVAKLLKDLSELTAAMFPEFDPTSAPQGGGPSGLSIEATFEVIPVAHPTAAVNQRRSFQRRNTPLRESGHPAPVYLEGRPRSSAQSGVISLAAFLAAVASKPHCMNHPTIDSCSG